MEYSLAENFHKKDAKHSSSINHPVARMQENVISLRKKLKN